MRLILISFINLTSLYLIFITEILSYFNFLNTNFTISLWIIFFSVIIVYAIYKKNNHVNKIEYDFNLFNDHKHLLSIITIILLITFFTSIFYLPTTADAMSYHIPRVMTWIQNSNVNFFPTPDQRMLFMPPFNSFLGTHLYLIFQNDYLFNFIQWFSMFFTMITVTMIVNEIGGNLRTQILSAFFLVTLPMGILQSTSTQTDYVITFWFLSFLFFLLRYKRTSKFLDIVCLSISLGIGILSKQTMYLFAFPFVILFLYSIEMKKIRKIIFHSFISIIIILSINFNHFKRTYEMYNNFTAFDDSNVSATNQSVSGKYFVSNLVRNFSLNLTLPNSNYNEIIRKSVKEIHQKLDISIIDSNNTFGDYYIYFNTYESHAPNTLHFFIIFIMIFYIFFKKNNFKYIKIYTACLIIGFLIFSLILKWQPGGNRFLLPLFSAFSVLFGFFANKIKNIQIGRFLILRPIISYTFNDNKKFSINFKDLNQIIKNPYKSYFIGDIDRYEDFHKISNLIHEKKCKNIGITRGYAEYEYPVRHFIKEKFYKEEVIFEYPYVENLSNKYETNKYDNLCAIISFKCYIDDINCSTNNIQNLPANLKPLKIRDRIVLYL